jgi:uncharacterized protein YqgV (UPF0045/DUF77 family)
MQASIEISLYPLRKDYETTIIQFIERLKSHPDLEVRPNTMSTQVFGDYDLLMDVLKKELKTSFQENADSLAVIKFANLNLR